MLQMVLFRGLKHEARRLHAARHLILYDFLINLFPIKEYERATSQFYLNLKQFLSLKLGVRIIFSSWMVTYIIYQQINKNVIGI
jgi:hypothetical protein